jgi:RHS repeat-associated protein
MSSWTSSNGLTNTLAYDSDGHLTGISVPGVQSQAFAYDAANRITQITDGMDSAMTEALGYDGSNRLMSETSGVDNESYSYDAVGNRVHQVISGATTTLAMAPTSNHLVTTSGASTTTWGYDAEGAMTSANGAHIWYYSPFHRLINANGTDYVIGAEGQRLRKTGGPGTTYFAPDRSGTLLAEDQNGTWLDYVWLNGRVVAAMVGGGVYPVHGDQTGRPVAVTAAGSPTVVWKARGLPFSTQITTNTWQTFNLGFPGQYHDAESGMWQNGTRDYNQYLGRYIESDPSGLAGGINTYVYAGGNPLSYTDPLGLWPGPPPMGPFSPLEPPLNSSPGESWTPAGCMAAYKSGMEFNSETQGSQFDECVNSVPSMEDPNGLVSCRLSVSASWWAADYVARQQRDACLKSCK